jgi:hypothetical protein
MSFRSSTPLELDAIASQASAATSGPSVPSAFGRMMAPTQATASRFVRDRCQRPEPVYNDKYDLSKPSPDNLTEDYSSYAYGELLYDDRALVVTRLPADHTLAGAAKRTRTSWVWPLGYALIANSKPKKPLVWACKLCTYKYSKFCLIY